MQRATDRQKTLAAHGALLSDERLRLQLTALATLRELEGRVLGHGQEDSTGRAYVLIEGTDAKVHFIYQEGSIDAARHVGLMRVNSFVRLRMNFTKGHANLVVEDLGDAEKVLDDKVYMRRRAQWLIENGVITNEVSKWGGWLGHYQARLQVEIEVLEATTPVRRHSLGGQGRY